jgi:hypothetical protein
MMASGSAHRVTKGTRLYSYSAATRAVDAVQQIMSRLASG